MRRLLAAWVARFSMHGGGADGLSLRRASRRRPARGAAHGAMAEPVWVGRFPSEGNTLPTPWKVEQFDERIAPTATRCASGMAWRPSRRRRRRAWRCWRGR